MELKVNEIMKKSVLKNKRGYFVKPHPEADTGYAVVATSSKEAKRELWKYSDVYGEGDWEWINLRATWSREAKIDHLPIGLIEDLKTGLEVGIFCYIENFECDMCGGDNNFVEYIDGKVVCEACKEEIERKKLEDKHER